MLLIMSDPLTTDTIVGYSLLKIKNMRFVVAILVKSGEIHTKVSKN